MESWVEKGVDEKRVTEEEKREEQRNRRERMENGEGDYWGDNQPDSRQHNHADTASPRLQ